MNMFSINAGDEIFEVSKPNKERWIFIFSDDYDEPDDFVTLVKAYRDMVNGRIYQVSELPDYKIENDKLSLTFQWDDCFGITVVVPDETDINIAFETLKNLCDKLNRNGVCVMSKKQNLKEKEQQIIAEIENIAGFTPSRLLLSLILHPERVNTLNNDCLKSVVTEYAPYFQKTSITLDGPDYMAYFNISLLCRVGKKPELNAVLYGK